MTNTLSQIVDENSDGGKAITNNELSNYAEKTQKSEIKKDLEIAKNNPKFQQQLIIGLQDYLQGKEISKQSNKTEILALQMLQKLQGKKTQLDGIFDSKTMNNFEDKSNLSNKLKGILEKIQIDENTPNANELIQQIINNLIQEIIKEFKEKGKIGLDAENLYSIINQLLESTDNNLSESNPLKGTLRILKNNYLTPKDKGIRIINLSLTGATNYLGNNQDNLKIDKDSFKTIHDIISSTIGSLIDIAKTPGSDKKINTLIDELINIDKIKKFLGNYPDIEKIIRTILPKTLKKLDKEKVIEGLNDFFSKNKNLLYEITTAEDSNKIHDIDKKRLKLTNDFLKAFENVIDENIAGGILDNIKDLDFIKNNEIASRIVKALTHPNITDNKRNEILKDVKEFSILATDSDAKEENLTNILDKCIGHTAYLLSICAISEDDMVIILSKALNIDPKQEIKFMDNRSKSKGFEGFKEKYISPIISGIGSGFDKLFGKEKNQTNQDIGINDYSKLMELLWNNKGNIVGITKDLFTQNFKTYEDLIRYLVKERIIQKTLQDNNNKIISKLKQAIDFSIKDGLNIAKDKLTETKDTMLTSIKSPGEKQISNTQDKGKQLFATIQTEIFDHLSTQLESSQNINGGKTEINKNDITKFLKEIAQKVLLNHQDKLIELAQSYGLKLSDPKDKEQLINVAQQICDHPNFQKLLSNIIDGILGKIDTNKNVLSQISDIIYEIKTKGPKSLDQKTIQTGIDITLDTLENQLNNPETISFIINNIPGLKEFLPKNLSQKDILGIIKTLKDSSFLKVFAKKLSIVLGKKSSNNLAQELTSNIGSQLVKETIADPKVNKQLILNYLEKSNLLEKINGNGESKIDEKLITKENISNTIDIAFDAIEHSNPEQITNILSKLGLDKIFGNSLYQIIKDLNEHGFKNKLKEILGKNIEFIKDAINGNIDQTKLVNIIDELYNQIPSEKRLNLVNKLIEYGILDKTKTKVSERIKIKVNLIESPQIDGIVNIVYNTLGSGDKKQICQTLDNILGKYGFSEIIKQKIMGQSLSENIVDILNIVGKEGFRNFLQNNLETINRIHSTDNQQEKTSLSTKIGIDFIKLINPEKFRGNYEKKQLNVDEQILLKHFEGIQKTISQFPKLEKLGSLSLKIKQYLDTKKVDNTNDIKEYANILFEFVNKLLSNINDKILSQDINILVGGKKTNKQNQEFTNLLTKVFIKNNILFCGKTFFSQFFNIILGKGINKGETIIDYFSNKNNQDNFEDTLCDFFEK